MCQFTAIPMTRFKASFLLQNLSQWRRTSNADRGSDFSHRETCSSLNNWGIVLLLCSRFFRNSIAAIFGDFQDVLQLKCKLQGGARLSDGCTLGYKTKSISIYIHIIYIYMLPFHTHHTFQLYYTKRNQFMNIFKLNQIWLIKIYFEIDMPLKI